MDKIGRIKRLVESSLDTSFGGGVVIQEMIVLPTHTYDETINEWVPDSHTVFLSIQKMTDPKLMEENYSAIGFTGPSQRISDFLENLLGLEVCVDVV